MAGYCILSPKSAKLFNLAEFGHTLHRLTHLCRCIYTQHSRQSKLHFPTIILTLFSIASTPALLNYSDWPSHISCSFLTHFHHHNAIVSPRLSFPPYFTRPWLRRGQCKILLFLLEDNLLRLLMQDKFYFKIN